MIKEADLGWFFDKVGNQNVIRPREDRNISITRLLNEVGYVIAASEYQRDTVMIQKDGTVKELPQIDLNVNSHFLEDYDNKGIIYQELFTDNGAGLPYSDYPFGIKIPYQDFLGKDTLEM
ncbi:hypothetical protein SAMN02910451_02912 [Butyrivibrio hungatei]|uniref:Uncharacterized protein n=1 Tax=Butyrivibrio hungatei TaxID=185008 RepID=A0A1G5GKC9_9FIRM|nr:hypothetical protein [Butyrivibrio hungatei]SCY51789.1 hypothetical protein SAMN02910451_02912 [Butyrivibrio hungatei]